jgi:hypothetical protein
MVRLPRSLAGRQFGFLRGGETLAFAMTAQGPTNQKDSLDSLQSRLGRRRTWVGKLACGLGPVHLIGYGRRSPGFQVLGRRLCLDAAVRQGRRGLPVGQSGREEAHVPYMIAGGRSQGARACAGGPDLQCYAGSFFGAGRVNPSRPSYVDFGFASCRPALGPAVRARGGGGGCGGGGVGGGCSGYCGQGGLGHCRGLGLVRRSFIIHLLNKTNITIISTASK